MRRKRRLKRKVKRIISFLITIICVIALAFSLFNIFKWKLDAMHIDDQVKNINSKIKTKDVDDGEILSTDANKENPYWDYIKMDLMDVDFSKLKNINDEVVGFIKVNGTNINYPFVQANDNEYYLNHSFNKSKNSAGWVFLDYRNNIKKMDQNTIIYAHGRLDKTMFGTLKNILSTEWVDDQDNFVVKLSTENENTLWQIFSVYTIPTTSDYLTTNFTNDNSYNNFLNTLINRSSYDFKASIDSNDKILTLSTCYNDKERVVLHAKLIKRQKK